MKNDKSKLFNKKEEIRERKIDSSIFISPIMGGKLQPT